MLSQSGSISTAENCRKEHMIIIKRVNSSALLYQTIYTVGVNKVWVE